MLLRPAVRALLNRSLARARCDALSRPGACGTRSDQRGGAHDRNRTDDLLLTMEMLYRLSYVGLRRPRRPMTRQRGDHRREDASCFGRDADLGRRLERRKDALPQDVFSLENTPGERTSTAIYCGAVRYVNAILGVRSRWLSPRRNEPADSRVALRVPGHSGICRFLPNRSRSEGRRRVAGALGEVDHGAVMRGELLDGRQDANGAAGPKIYDEARFQRSDGMESRSRRQR